MERRFRGVLVVLVTVGVYGCATGGGSAPARLAPVPRPSLKVVTGRASWYGQAHHGRLTASGERFDMNDLTAAHRTLPFGTRVRVLNSQNGREVVVRINDRGPHIRDRIIDLSKAAATAIDLLQAGEAPVVLFAP